MSHLPRPRSAADDVAGLAGLAQQFHDAVERGVARMRSEGATWTEVASSLGVSRSAAHRKWRHVDEALRDVEIGVSANGGAFVRHGRWTWSSAELRGELDGGAQLRALVASAVDEGLVDVIDGEAVRR